VFTIASAASDVVGWFGWDYDQALTFATDVARGRGIETGAEGDQASHGEIDEDTWRTIWEEAAVGSETTQY
jgi:hypothetical protein